MRRLFALFALLLIAGCTQPAPDGNATNDTNVTPPVANCTGPVCGSDLITYQTDCEAALANVSVQYSGECIIEENCTDSDGGVNASVSGTASRGNQTMEDYCVDAEILTEYSCEGNEIQEASVQCGEGQICRGGACENAPPPPEPEKNGTQGCSGPSAEDIYRKETVTFNGTNYTDYCIEFKVVKDYFCKNGKVDFISHECPPAYGCIGGQCEYQQTVCSETDDGNDTKVRGETVVVRGINTLFRGTDECIDEGTIKEYMCLENGSAKSEEIQCASGFKCASGKCIRGACSETDGGFNIYKGGITTADDTDYEDECIDDYELTEYYCYGDEVRSDVKRCPKGYICNDVMGRCNEGSID